MDFFNVLFAEKYGRGRDYFSTLFAKSIGGGGVTYAPSLLYLTLTSNLEQLIYVSVGAEAQNKFYIDWGDGSDPDLTINVNGESDNLFRKATHKYNRSGDYIVKINSAGIEANYVLGGYGLTQNTILGGFTESGDKKSNFPQATAFVFGDGAYLIPTDFDADWGIYVPAAFGTFTSLLEITIPERIATIPKSTFSGCVSLMKITVLNTTPPTLGENALLDVPANCAICVLAESVDAYKAAYGWRERANYIQAKPEA